MNAEEKAMEVWCKADLAVAGGNVVAHREHIAEAIREAQREEREGCIKILKEADIPWVSEPLIARLIKKMHARRGLEEAE